MTQERKRTYKRKTVDNITAASTEMGNVPPQATDIEEAVLGAMMVNTDSVDQVMDLLKPDAFYDITLKTTAKELNIPIIVIEI